MAVCSRKRRRAVEGDGNRLGSPGKRHSRARFAVNPQCGARRAVNRPENNHQTEPCQRSDQPPPESPFNPERFAASFRRRHVIHEVVQAAEGLNQQEQIDTGKAHDDREEGAPELSLEESPPKVVDTANPEKVAGNKQFVSFPNFQFPNDCADFKSHFAAALVP